MASFSLLVEVQSLTRAIHNFQHNICNKKAFYIETILQELVNSVASTKLINFSCLDLPKKKTRAATSTSSHFYNFFWLTNANKFPKGVACSEKVIVNSQTIDSPLQQLIISAVTSAIVTIVVNI